MAALALLLVACSDDTPPPTTVETTTTVAETTTTVAETTTTVAALTIEGAPEGLVAAVDSLFGDRAAVDPAFSDHLAGAPAGAEEPLVYDVALGSVGEAEVAVVYDDVDTILAVAEDGETWMVVGGSLASLGASPWYGSDLIQLYLIGSDARPNETVEFMRADSHHIVTIMPDGSTASVVGIPRDTAVTTPEGSRGKFTNVMANQGPERVVATAEILTGLEFDGYLLTGFAGFTDLIDAFGGFEVDVPLAMNDKDSKAYLDQGIQWLDGTDMLAFTRNRKQLAGGDFTRQFHHGVVMQWGLAAAQTQGPEAIPAILGMLDEFTLTDLSATQMIRVAGAVQHVDPFATPNVVVPARHGSIGGAYAAILTDGAHEIFARLADGPLPPEDE